MKKKECEFVKIRLGSGDSIETVWAEVIASGVYRLENTPCFAYGVSFQDVITAKPDPDGVLTMRSVLRKGGNRTIRVVFDNPMNDSLETRYVMDRMVESGCTYEGAASVAFTVNIPPRIELFEIAEFLTSHGVRFEYADPTYEELFPNESADE